MTTSTQRKLLALQKSLIPGPEPLAQQRIVVPFTVDGALFAIKGVSVQRVLLPVDVLRFLPSQLLPNCIVGVVMDGQDVLTVVDAGVLLRGQATAQSVSTRLIVMGGEGVRGLALLVDRVLDLVEESEIADKMKPLEPSFLLEKIENAQRYKGGEQ